MSLIRTAVWRNENRFPQVVLTYYQVLLGSDTVVREEPFHIHYCDKSVTEPSPAAAAEEPNPPNLLSTYYLFNYCREF